MAGSLNFTPGKYGDVFNYLDKQPKGMSEYDGQNLNQMADWQVPEHLQNYLSLDYTPGFETEGGPVAGSWAYNTHNLPGTKFGNDLSNIMLIRNQGDYDKLKNKNMAYYDPNYGFITTHSNYDDSSWEDYIPTAIMAAGTAGFGALAAPAIAAGFGAGPWAGKAAWTLANIGKNYAFGQNDENVTPTIQAQGLEQSNPTGTNNMYNSNLAGLYGIPNTQPQDMLSGIQDTPITGGGDPNLGGDSGTFGGLDLGSLVNRFTQGGLTSPAGYLAGIGMATKQWNDADKWMNKSEEWAQGADPFGKYRQGYGDQLQKLNENPSEYLKTLPGYQAALEASSTAGMQRLLRGQSGMSNAMDAITSAAGGVADKTYQAEAARLAKLAGADIDPATAARLRMSGMENSVNSQNAALGSLFAPLGSQMQQNASGNGSSGGLGDLIKQIGGGGKTTIGNIADVASKLGLTGNEAAIFNKLAANNPGISPEKLLGVLKGGGLDDLGYGTIPSDDFGLDGLGYGNLPDPGYDLGLDGLGYGDLPNFDYDFGVDGLGIFDLG